jgi:hypothetical protein
MKEQQSNLALLPERESQSDAQPELKAWALVELFGHQRIVGKVTVDPVDFPGMVRVDVPDLLKNGEVERAGFTRFLAVAHCIP